MEWFIRTKQDSKYPDLYTYDIMEKNPDAGKSGVVYSGDALFICNTDHKPSAHLIASAPELYEAVKAIVNDILHDEGTQVNKDSQLLLLRALDHAEGKV